MPTEKRSTTYRLSDEARQLVQELADFLGINQTAVVEMAVRELARRHVPKDHGKGTADRPKSTKQRKK